MSNQTKSDILESLSVQLAEELLRRIEEGTATPADLNVARGLLKDNNIVVNKESDHPATKLSVVLPFEGKKAVNE